jgi:hypothetical protein
MKLDGPYISIHFLHFSTFGFPPAFCQEQSSSPDLKDLLRLFLLRQPLPSQRVVDLLSRSVVALLLRIQALFAVADGHQLMSHQDVTAMDLTDLTAENVEIFSAMAWWPVEDLLIATDYGDTQHAAGHFEPVMRLRAEGTAGICFDMPFWWNVSYHLYLCLAEPH